MADNPYGLDPLTAEDELRKRQGSILGAPVVATGMAAPTATAVNVPKIGDPQLAADKAEVSRLKSTRSGIAQFQGDHPIAGGILKGLEVAGSILAPRAMSMVPGTELHHQQLLGTAQKNVAADEDVLKDEAATGHINAQATAAANPVQKTPFEVWHAANPTTDISEYMKLEANAKDTKNLSPEQQAFNEYAKTMSPTEAYKKVKEDAAGAKPGNDFQQYYDDFLKDNGLVDSAHNRLRARSAFQAAGQAPQRDPQQLAVGPDGTVIALKPGVKVPQGTKTVSGDLAGPKVNADEQKRADMARNLNENLDALEEIVNRRPELFGPFAGRMTGAKMAFGTDDPDVAALDTIKHQLGMVQQSTHSMRSAQGVEASAQSIINSFHNEPAAMKGAINAARNSAKTFTSDAQRAGGNGAPESNAQPSHIVKDAQGNRTGTVVNGAYVPDKK